MYRIYFAGDLFDHKHITGNYLLAHAIATLSNNRYQCILPQDWEGSVAYKPIDLRNRDIKEVMQADAVIFNFDGPDLDSGTVVEFVIAKMLDVPAILFRTDSRNGSHFCGDDWNLMVSGYPRCRIVKHDARVLYNDHGLQTTHHIMAQSLIDAMEKVRQDESILQSAEEMIAVYQQVVKLCGGNLDKVITLSDIQKIVEHKLERKKNLMQEKVQKTNWHQ